MDKAAFTEHAPGDIVEVTPGDPAFVPAPLPPTWEFGVEMWPTLADVRQQLGLLDGMAQQLDEPDLLLRPLQQREALRSSSLEGTYATPEELMLFELEAKKRARNESAQVNAWREVFNYAEALRLRNDTTMPLNQTLIRQLHAVLMTGVRGRDKDPGRYRNGQVYIGVGKRFTPPPITHLQQCLDELQNYIQKPEDSLDPLVRCFIVHYQFETIHPFSDGNGRVGRLLLATMIQEWCGLDKPWLYLSAFFDKHKDDYIDRLFAVSARGDWHGWIHFCLQGALQQIHDTVARARGLQTLRKEFLNRITETKGNIRLNLIVDELFKMRLITVPKLQEMTGVTYPTGKKDIDRLVEVGILSELPGQSVKTFFSRELFDLAFFEGQEPAAG